MYFRAEARRRKPEAAARTERGGARMARRIFQRKKPVNAYETECFYCGTIVAIVTLARIMGYSADNADLI
ncbi:MAG: hypothetical protein A2W52_01635 [Candidatus Taylorbacteria bacterium RIFCSPHIGHO2_02_49_25]|uniref:Uncharacterized protein n=1 Tax=Candidatus Taylorbacteria bacterium RIFCSPHIGHO2_02_49_25 TaxID=1802305 RepID=A0A1G2MBL1_9BACT|nr:MAG: hypothetical protein A2759_00470 [Candidatus Taylorbacteria bacterium RIFCSPHIGHO2_01_FULL_49_60]OHA21094.1 MAG: hypothetical protein A2W52_01635 [Candidatus Taylorbacteria bacterium RIFCSPHIGHO2_02_49_25]OHA35936.1 MAG: hypothetical protein A3B27_01810 [Candidatus Taylorbacteria bacterium RIFCSPLOWO2_01_FULL_50_130]OHA37319.1 MAG: hypothetical protein A2W65_03550 [Candidatus Taylorbacteria bacterium RIFCSPLOWO2_02_50_13]OHA40408.1 MAG: hypothetical protein A3H73_01425 [Candidatus Taylo